MLVTYVLDEPGILFLIPGLKKLPLLLVCQEDYNTIVSEVGFIAKLIAWANTEPHDELVLELQKILY